MIVKLGGSLITDKEVATTARPQVIARLAAEIAAARPGMPQHLIVGHGSGSFGHVAASAAGLGDGAVVEPGSVPTEALRRGMATTQHQAASLHRQLVDTMVEAGLGPYGWAASSALMAKAGVPRKGQIQPLLHAMGLGLLPVIYGDVVQDTSWGVSICSTETLVRYLMGRLRRAGFRIQRILWCGETDGIYDREGRTIEEVSSRNLFSVRRQIGVTRGTDVTGGMHLRLATCHALARRGVESWLLNGLTPGHLQRALRGERIPATRFPAKEPARDGR